jgi:hypothetical protein
LLRGCYSASSLIRTHPPPSRRRSISRLSRLYDLPCSGDFSPGRGGLLQLLGMSLSPCCRFHPAEVVVPCRSDFGTPCCLRPTVAGSALGATHFRGHIRVHCRYGPVTRDLPKGDLSIGFRILVSRHPAIRTTGLLTLAPAGLSPAEHASLCWTHNRTCGFPASGSPTGFMTRHTAADPDAGCASASRRAVRTPRRAGNRGSRESAPYVCV